MQLQLEEGEQSISPRTAFLLSEQRVQTSPPTDQQSYASICRLGLKQSGLLSRLSASVPPS